MDDREFERLVEAAIETLPQEFLEKLKNVAVVVEDLPTPSQIKKLRERGGTGLLLGLYEGVPQTKRRHYGVGGTLPDKITVFKESLMAISPTRLDLITNVRNTVIHEIAHHFGMDEKMVRDAEKSKLRK